MNFLALGAVVLWSLYAAFIVNVTQMPALFLIGATLTIGGIITMAGFRHWKWNRSYFLITALSLFFYNICLFVGFQKGHPLVVNFLNYLWPVLIVVVSVLLNPKKKLTSRQALGVGIAFLGCALVFLSFAREEGNYVWTGYVFALVAAVLWALYSNLIEQFKNISSWNVGPPTFAAGLASLGLSYALGESWSIQPYEIPWVVLLGVGPMGLAFVLWQAGIQKFGVRSVASLSYLTPVLSSFWLSMAINQPFHPSLVFALVLVLIGMWISGQKSAT